MWDCPYVDFSAPSRPAERQFCTNLACESTPWETKLSSDSQEYLIICVDAKVWKLTGVKGVDKIRESCNMIKNEEWLCKLVQIDLYMLKI